MATLDTREENEEGKTWVLGFSFGKREKGSASLERERIKARGGLVIKERK